MDTLFFLKAFIALIIVGTAVYGIVHGLFFQEPEVPATGATRSRSIQR